MFIVKRQREINGRDRAGMWTQQSESRAQLVGVFTLPWNSKAGWGTLDSSSWALASLSRDFLILPEACLNFLPLDIIRKTNFFPLNSPPSQKCWTCSPKVTYPLGQTQLHHPSSGTYAPITTPTTSSNVSAGFTLHMGTHAQHAFAPASTPYIQINYLFVGT